MGPVMVDVAGLVLTDEERTRLRHPLTGGVILFARNYASPEQLSALTAEIHAVRTPPLLIAVDHEGGRIQRFRDGFMPLPPMRRLGEYWERDSGQAKAMAAAVGYVLASELARHGLDLSFTPVLDVDFGNSSVIGDRAFHSEPSVIAELATSLVEGMRQADMAAVGKHFPGHGHVRADSHHEIPVDDRVFADISRKDLVPFRELVNAGLGGIMPAHVIYPDVDSAPAGFSKRWLQGILRQELAFDGVIFSDDLSMEGASVAGDIVGRADAALDAGCDMVLVCNAPATADDLLQRWQPDWPKASLQRLRVFPRPGLCPAARDPADKRYREALMCIASLSE